jgi:hypothetical protein
MGHNLGVVDRGQDRSNQEYRDERQDNWIAAQVPRQWNGDGRGNRHDDVLVCARCYALHLSILGTVGSNA